jgi:hypothetical protein
MKSKKEGEEEEEVYPFYLRHVGLLLSGGWRGGDDLPRLARVESVDRGTLPNIDI